jgi:hypothetical protein
LKIDSSSCPETHKKSSSNAAVISQNDQMQMTRLYFADCRGKLQVALDPVSDLIIQQRIFFQKMMVAAPNSTGLLHCLSCLMKKGKLFFNLLNGGDFHAI